MDDIDNLLSLVSHSDNDWYQDAAWKDKAAQERIEVARHQIKEALKAARQGDCRQAAQLLIVVQNMLQENNLEPDEWVEIYVAQMICHARLGEGGAAKSAWKKAYALQPDNEKLQEVAMRLELI